MAKKEDQERINMVRTAKYDPDTMLRFQVSWAEQIAAKDSDYTDYAGASEEVGLKLARIDTMLLLLPKENPLTTLLKFQRTYLIQIKKAIFATIKTGEISQLGFLKGGKPFDIDAIIEPKSEIP